MLHRQNRPGGARRERWDDATPRGVREALRSLRVPVFLEYRRGLSVVTGIKDGLTHRRSLVGLPIATQRSISSPIGGDETVCQVTRNPMGPMVSDPAKGVTAQPQAGTSEVSGCLDTWHMTLEAAVHVYTQTGFGWGENAEITPVAGAAKEFFGDLATISGGKIVVGARDTTASGNIDQGMPYVFTGPSVTWNLAVPSPPPPRHLPFCASPTSGPTSLTICAAAKAADPRYRRNCRQPAHANRSIIRPGRDE
jgi:hypothetical protein